MKFFEKLFNNTEENSFNYRLVLDIGTEYLKLAMIEFNKNEKNLISFARVKQDYGNMDGGAITNIDGVSAIAKKALEDIKDKTPYQTVEMITGLAGEFVKGILLSFDVVRDKPDKKLDKKELDKIMVKGQEKAYKKALEKAEMETGFKDIEFELIHYNLVEIKVDGYKVNNPEQFQGKNVSILAFYTFAPLVQLGALRTIARDLGTKLIAVMPEPLAVASSILNIETYEFGAIIIDIGGGTTDIALIRNGGIEGSRMFAMGGRAFTRTLASNLNLTLDEAEKVKLAYSKGENCKDYNRIDKLLKSDMQILYQGIELSLRDLAQGEILPKNIYFCGGGSALKGLKDGLENYNLEERLPFGQKVEISLLDATDIKSIEDQFALLKGIEYTTPKSLAYCGTKVVNKEWSVINFESKII
ncbi:cell division FtsA domain-containing protein [Natronospora cellulosivora (SeqCode)]